jgi:hypothetical protein
MTPQIDPHETAPLILQVASLLEGERYADAVGAVAGLLIAAMIAVPPDARMAFAERMLEAIRTQVRDSLT